MPKSFIAVKFSGAAWLLCLGLMTACGNADYPGDALEVTDDLTGDADTTVTWEDVADDTPAAEIPDQGLETDATIDDGADADACIPDCGPRRCGPDGCGGSCGECPVGWECEDVLGWYCAPPPCRELMDSWSPSGVIDSLHFPKTVDEMQGCIDYTPGNGVDGGMLVMATTLDEWAQGFIAAAKPVFILEFAGLRTGNDQQEFTLNMLAGEPVTPGMPGGEMYVDDESYEMDVSCLANASIFYASFISGSLYAGPDAVRLEVPISDALVVAPNFADVTITAHIEVGENGVYSNDGVISGILYRDEYLHILDLFATECAKDPVPDEIIWACPNLAQFQEYAETMFDIHATEDGTYTAPDAEHPANAASFCAKFTLAPATIVGFTPPQ